MWLTSIDGRERPAHREAHRQTVPKGAPFLVGGESLMAPGIGGSAANIVNCRCTTKPIVTRRAGQPTAQVELHTNGVTNSDGHGPRRKTVLIERDADNYPVRVVEEYDYADDH